MDLEIEKLIQLFVSKLEKKKALKALHKGSKNSNKLSKNTKDVAFDTKEESSNQTDSGKGNSDFIEETAQQSTSKNEVHIVNDIEKAIESISSISLSPATSEKVPETWDMLTLVDTGGQPEFINMLPAISTATDVTFVVLNLSDGKECLSKEVEAQHSDPGYNNCYKKYTNKQLLKCLLASINESSNKMPFYPSIIDVQGNRHSQLAVCFIGTHADVVINSGQDISEVIDAVNKEIIACLNNTKVAKDLDVWNYNGKVLVAVDNTTAGRIQIKDSIAEKIRHKVFQDVIRKNAQYEIPLTWFILELQLRCEDKVFLTLGEVKSLAYKIMPEDFKMEEWQLIEALKFYHSIGVLLYFHEKESGMSDIVITDPQWLFKNLTKLATCTFVKDKFVSNANLTKFANEGIFNAKLLDDIDLDVQVIKRDSFLKLLTYLKIVAPLDDSNQEYFMPSILPTSECNVECDLDNVFGCQVFYKPKTDQCVKVEPLRIQFASGTIPRGLFCFLTVQLLHDKVNWKLYGTNNDKILYRYDNLITFRIDTYHYLTLLDRITYLELQVRIKDDKPSFVYYQVQNAIAHSMKIVCKRIDWQYNNIRYGFLCQKCFAECDHLTYLSNDEPIPCKIPDHADCGRQGTKLTEAHKVWFSV